MLEDNPARQKHLIGAEQLREKIVKRWLTACTGNLESAVISMGLRLYGF
jgi:hypothetical protein